MTLSHTRPILSLIVALLSFVQTASGQGNTSGNFSDPGTGARQLGLGNAYVAVADDVYAINANPAGLATMDRASVSFDYADVFNLGLIKQSYIAGAFPTRWGTHGLHYRGTRFGFDPFPQTLTESTLGYSYGRHVGPIALGTTIKYFDITSDFEQGTATGFGLDLGLRYQWTDRWSLGGSVQNLLSNLKYGTGTTESIPVTWRLGGGFRFSDRWMLSSELAGVSGDGLTNFRLGTEFWILRPSAGRPRKAQTRGESIFRREEAEALPFSFGVRAGMDKQMTGANTLIPSLGTTIGFASVRFDYAFLAANNGLGSTHRYSLTYDFKPWESDEEEIAEAEEQAITARARGEEPRPIIPPQPSAAPSAAPTAPVLSRGAVVVAVSDFANATGDPAMGWLESGYAEIVNKALRNEGIALAPRSALAGTASMSGPDIRDRAADLGASIVVRGLFVRTSPGMLMLSARLIDVASGRTIEQVAAEGPESQIFQIGGEFAAKVAARAREVAR